MRMLVAFLAIGSLVGCSVVALPLHVAADIVDVVPVVGSIAAAPIEAAADIID